MTTPSSNRNLEPCGAKTKALENAVWKQDKRKRKSSPTASEPTTAAPKRKRASASKDAPTRKDSHATACKSRPQKPATLKRQHTSSVDTDVDDGFSDGDKKIQKARYRRPCKLRRTFAMQDVALANEHEPSGVNSDDAQHSDADRSDTAETEDENSIDTAAMMLSDEIASLVTDDQKPQKSKGSARGTGLKETAQDRKQAMETPTWGDYHDVDDAISESVEDTTTAELEFFSDNEGTIPKVQTSSSKSIASLTRRVIQVAITEVKCHLIFDHGYPELVDKNQLSMQSLLTVAEQRGMHAIKERLQLDEVYASQLGALVDARIPILRRELKDDACANIDGYFRLGHKDFAKAKALTEKLTYVFALKFDSNNNIIPIKKMPYQGEILLLLISNQLFHSSKAIGVTFVACFVEIAKNKARHPKVPIPLLALVVTAVYSALLWKSLGSPGKFNFSGNQFSETYSYHVKFLKELKEDAPGKFHPMMADIYEAAKKFRQSGVATDHAELDAFELLDLDGMHDEDSN